MLQRPGLAQGIPDSGELQAQIRQMQSLLRSQQRQILEHQEALAELHDLITSQVETLLELHIIFMDAAVTLPCCFPVPCHKTT